MNTAPPKLPRIECWSCTRQSDDPFKAPERVGLKVQGRVYDHPDQPDGKTITTSRIVSVAGREITTKSGSVYLLGEPDPEWLTYLESIGKPYDPAQPIRVLQK